MSRSLTAPQYNALRMLDEEGSYGQFRRSVRPRYSMNWYHEYHRPGNLYIDVHTARVLIEKGLAEVTHHGRLRRTEAGTAMVRGH